MNYCVITNAYQGIALADPPPSGNPKLQLNQCIIDNAYDAGIIAVNSSMNAVNTLVSNCGKNIVLAKGGNYELDHCTSVAYSTSYILHKEPAILISNFIVVNNQPISQPLSANIRNCIFWGDGGTVSDEVVVLRNGSDPYNVNFSAVLWKNQNPPSNVTATQVINNQNPQFDSIDVSRRIFNFHLKSTSPAKDAGNSTSILIDLDGKPRPAGPRPDLGAYEQ